MNIIFKKIHPIETCVKAAGGDPYTVQYCYPNAKLSSSISSALRSTHEKPPDLNFLNCTAATEVVNYTSNLTVQKVFLQRSS